jgi:hypothetical protein
MQRPTSAFLATLLILDFITGGCAFISNAQPISTSANPVKAPAPASTAQSALPPDDPVEGWAVLAQKDHYEDVGMTSLDVDYIDIGRMREALENLGWMPENIHEVREFDEASLTAELNWLETSADENDLVILYVTSHGKYLSHVIHWNNFVPREWKEIRSRQRVLLVDSCTAAKFTKAITGDAQPHLSIAAVDEDEYGWKGVAEEGLPIIGGVFTYYLAEALDDLAADADANGRISVQEATAYAEQQQREYMHEVVLVVPAFAEGYHQLGVTPEEDPTFPDVIVDDRIGEPLYLSLAGEH